MKIWTFEGGYDNNFTYLFSDGVSLEAAIVDASVPFKSLKSTINKKSLTPSKLLVTHNHFDHTSYLDEYLSTYPTAEVCAIKSSNRWKNEKPLSDGDTFYVGGLNVKAIHTPGHTQDSTCFHVKDVLFSGDTIFVGRTGRTIGAGSNARQLYRSLSSKLLNLHGDTKIYPGHDYGHVKNISLKENIELSPLLQATNEDDFVKRMEEYERSR